MKSLTKEIISLPSRENITNKSDAGRVLIVGADLGMCGAACFSAKAAYRSGCGLVRAHIHFENRIPMQTLVPEAVLSFWEDGVDMPNLEQGLEWAHSVLVGIGFGKGETQKRILKKIVRESKKPLVIDADGLNILSENKALLKHLPRGTVLTPHPAELSRLTGESVEDITKDPVSILEKHFNNMGITVVAKNVRTVIFHLDNTVSECSLGNSSLSTGGTGDILAGMAASFMAQGLTSDASADAAVYFHALAGRSAGEALGQRSVMAGDVVDAIHKVLKDY